MAAKIGVGILGTGRISDLHVLEYIANPATEIRGLCDRNVELARQKASAWGLKDVKTITDDMDDIFSDSEIDLVEILLPHDIHLQAALGAMEAGKIISLQKPMCSTLEEADVLVEAVDGYDRPFKVFENFIFYPPVIKARELIDQGAIGKPISIRIKSHAGYSETEWEVPKSAQDWRQRVERSGGGPLVFDDGHHKFALAWSFMGNPAAVHSFIREVTREDGFVFDAPAMVSFLFPENRIGNLEIVYSPELMINTVYYAQDDRVEISGEKGIIWINGGHGKLGDSPPVILYERGRFTEFTNIPTGWEQSFILSTRDFINKVCNGGDPVLTARDAREILRFASAAEQSNLEGKTIYL
ncbi:MAG: Gfo/Idh/MocA family oxidoreductase [Rhodobacteraceae bacterium]|nr:Gfo/Idh/MocA family oxidoreductase [Paracoccaceae bacterium]